MKDLGQAEQYMLVMSGRLVGLLVGVRVICSQLIGIIGRWTVCVCMCVPMPGFMKKWYIIVNNSLLFII